MKKHIVIISTQFPCTHPAKGEKTKFLELIECGKKIHTIRANYELWKKRIDEVNRGEAVLQLKYWTGKPYHTPQALFKELKQGEVGIQKLQVAVRSYFIDGLASWLTTEKLANNDGLSHLDFTDWFQNSDFAKPAALIHFTNFRY